MLEVLELFAAAFVSVIAYRKWLGWRYKEQQKVYEKILDRSAFWDCSREHHEERDGVHRIDVLEISIPGAKLEFRLDFLRMRKPIHFCSKQTTAGFPLSIGEDWYSKEELMGIFVAVEIFLKQNPPLRRPVLVKRLSE